MEQSARGRLPLAGGLPSYHIYQTADDEWVAFAALEPNLWADFCAAVNRPDLNPRQFDPATLQFIKKIDVGKGPDGIYYDPAVKRVFTNNHGTHDITAIDAKTGETKWEQKRAKMSYNNLVANIKIYDKMADLMQQDIDLKQRDVDRKAALAKSSFGSQLDLDRSSTALVTSSAQLAFVQQQRAHLG